MPVPKSVRAAEPIRMATKHAIDSTSSPSDMNARMRSMRRTGRSSLGVRVLIRPSLAARARAVGWKNATSGRIPSCPCLARTPVSVRFPMPTGKVRFYDEEKGFGFITSDDGQDVFLHATALPAGAPAPKAGPRPDFGLAGGQRDRKSVVSGKRVSVRVDLG